MFTDMKLQFVLCAILITQVTAARAEQDEWAKILQAIKEQRDTIKSGYYSGIGISESFIEEEKKTVKGVLRLRVYFDFPGQKVRYEREAPAFALPDYKARKGGVYVQTPQKSVMRLLDSKDVYVGKPDQVSSVYLTPFDVRALGLAFYADYARGDSFEVIRNNYAKFKDNQITSNEDGRVTAVTMMSQALRRTIVIDTKRGYWPTRLVVEARKRESDGTLVWRDPPEVVSEVSVEQYQGVWLPVKYSIESTTRKDEFELIWQMVNGRHDPALFTAEGLDLLEER